MLLAIFYSCASSLAGIVPNKLPFVSEKVDKRVPTLQDIYENVQRQQQQLQDKREEDEKKS